MTWKDVKSADGEYICHTDDKTRKCADLEANAKLIAAAPELLEALEEAEVFIDSHSEDWYRSGQELLSKVRAAIKKATTPPQERFND